VKARKFYLFFIVIVAGLPGRSQAFFDFGVGDWLSGQNQMLAQLLACNLEELSNISALLANMKLVVAAGNESLALARNTYRAYRSVKNYTWQDLMRDAKKGFYDVFPDLYDIEQEAREYEHQYENRSRFFSYYGRHDYEMSRKLGAVLSHGYKAAIWPRLFPSAFDRLKKNPSPVDLYTWQLYVKSGMAMEKAVKSTSIYALSEKVQKLVEEAERRDQLDLDAQAISAQMAVQQTANSTEFLDLYRAQVAQEEAAHAKERKRRKATERELEGQAEKIFKAGGMLEK
jgi:hypothetical protein